MSDIKTDGIGRYPKCGSIGTLKSQTEEKKSETHDFARFCCDCVGNTVGLFTRAFIKNQTANNWISTGVSNGLQYCLNIEEDEPEKTYIINNYVCSSCKHQWEVKNVKSNINK